MSDITFLWERHVSPELVKCSWEAAFSRHHDTLTWNKLWDWRFYQNPLDEKPIAAYALIQGVVACFFSVSTLELEQPDGLIVKAGLAYSGFTHPMYQGKGLYVKMYKALEIELFSMGYQCLLGFDNHNSHYPEVKHLGCKDLAIATCFNLKSKDYIDNLAKNNNKIISCKHDIEVKNIVDDLSCFNYLCAGKYHIRRSSEFLKWRLINHPLNRYLCITAHVNNNLAGAIIYKTYQQREADIMEIFINTDYNIYQDTLVLSLIRFIVIDLGLSINMWSNLFSEEHLLLERVGFKETFFCSYFVLFNIKKCINISNVKYWHYRFIDSDIY